MDATENIVLSEVSQAQDDKVYIFSLICGIKIKYKYKAIF
jgi:hypothetical protein